MFPGEAMLFFLLLNACISEKDTSDQDGDGISAAIDCDDQDADIGEAALSAYADQDGDGVGAEVVQVCVLTPQQATVGGDCDDHDPRVAAGFPEYCDGLDQDCNGHVDDAATDATSWFLDTDGDGFGTAQQMLSQCTQPEGYVADGSDCNDNNSGIYVGAAEICDQADQDCDGVLDNDVIDGITVYRDGDEDGYGDLSQPLSVCSWEVGTSYNGEDCDDTLADISPEGTEICGNNIDEDCDGADAPCGWRGDYNLADASAIIRGEVLNEQMGNALVSLGDVDGDGLVEVAVGAYQANLFAGRAWILKGSDLVGDASIDTVATATFTGETEYLDAARVLAGVGDVSGDGVPDLLIGSDRAGTAWVVSGDRTGTASLATADTQIVGDGQAMFGTSVSKAGDVNGDGQNDLLVSAPNQGSGMGAGYLFLGPVNGTVNDEDAYSTYLGAAGDYAGYTVTGGHDLDGDGLDDPIVASFYGPSAHGAVWVMTHSTSGNQHLSQADAVLGGTTYTDRMATAVASIGDSNGDGYGDVLVGAPGDTQGGSSAGAVYLLQGPLQSGDIATQAVSTFVGETGISLGGSLADVGDLNNDTYSDICISAPARNSYEGAVYVAYGTPSTGNIAVANMDAIFVGEAASNYAGTAMAAGDVSGDAAPDLLITASTWGRNQSLTGALFVMSSEDN